MVEEEGVQVERRASETESFHSLSSDPGQHTKHFIRDETVGNVICRVTLKQINMSG